MSTSIVLVNSFTRAPFAGNPAGVCLLPSWRDESWMQSIAAEMNVPETAFVVPDGPRFGLRWFTPVTEVPLCGHATLATAHVLFELGRVVEPNRIRFMTASGELAATRDEDQIELDFPALPVTPCQVPANLVPALGASPTFVGHTASGGAQAEVIYLCELSAENTVRSLRPDLQKLREVPGSVIVTARGAGRHAIVSRFFAPAIGIDEDPVTGIAHCALAPYWAPRLERSRFLAWQASARGGEIEVTLRDTRVGLAGHAVTIWSGECVV
jgi:PhzF family phenazine biosynthesis protein